MRKSAPEIMALLLLIIFGFTFRASLSHVQNPDWTLGIGGERSRMVRQENRMDIPGLHAKKIASESELDLEIRRVMENGGKLEERRRQIPAIATSFALRADPQRARYLSALCYLKTLGTSFMPFDMAEIALAETGSHGLSGKASSSRGAIGVWQLMPIRANSHGYSSKEMENDQKCADAAVRELAAKLTVANGNLEKAKKLYCGIGQEADAYELKLRKYRKELLDNLDNSLPGKGKQVHYNTLSLESRVVATASRPTGATILP